MEQAVADNTVLQRSDLKDSFATFIRSDAFPCVGAKAALAQDAVTIIELPRINRSTADIELYRAICRFGETLDPKAVLVQSFVAMFESPCSLSEKAFEAALWDRLQALHNLDVATGTPWAEEAEADPTSPHFSMSIGGHAYFVIGLHPNASREARRFDRPVMVFNSREQFDRLKADGRFETMRKIIRKRDRELEGDINPMLRDFGEASEALQYSGRQVDESWACPLHIHEGARDD